MINTEIKEPEGDLHDVDHDLWVANEARRMGFPVAGTMADLYEDAVILIPGLFKFDWGRNKVKIGRVIHISSGRGYDVVSFVIQTEDGTQVPCHYGRTYDCFFALPEDSEGFAQ